MPTDSEVLPTALPKNAPTTDLVKEEAHTHRDLQRRALRELVELTSTCAGLEVEIERRRVAATEENELKDKRAVAELERSYKNVQEQIATKQAERKQEISARCKEKVEAVKAADSSLKRKMRHEYESLQKEIKHKFEQAVWLSESVLEAAEGKISLEMKKAVELHTSQNEMLDGKEIEAQQVIDRYGFQLPVVPAVEETPAMPPITGAPASQGTPTGQAVPAPAAQASGVPAPTANPEISGDQPPAGDSSANPANAADAGAIAVDATKENATHADAAKGDATDDATKVNATKVNAVESASEAASTGESAPETAALDQPISSQDTAVMVPLQDTVIPPEGSVGPAPAAQAAPVVDPVAAFAQHRETVEKRLQTLSSLTIPSFFIGIRATLVVILLILIAAFIPQWQAQTINPQWQGLGIWVGSMAVVVTIGIVLLRILANRQLAAQFIPLRRALDGGRTANEQTLILAKQKREIDLANAKQRQKQEVKDAKEKATPILERALKKRDSTIQASEAEATQKIARYEQEKAAALAENDQTAVRKSADLDDRYKAGLATIAERTRARLAEIISEYDGERAALELKWKNGLARIQEPMQEDAGSYLPWSDPSWNDYKAPTRFPATLRFGQLQVDLKTIVADVAKDAPFSLPLPDIFEVPALMAFPRQASLLIHTDRNGRADAVSALQMTMTRLLTCLPPGRVRFTLIDPVGLGQNFAGFMHLADYDESLVGGRIWTDAEQIDQRLTNLTEHMETVIQKYLRNEYETIDDYNAQAGELAEPYRFLVVCDFPVNFNDESLRRLSSIASTGARCGVYTLIVRDTRVAASQGTHLDDLESHSINLVRDGDRFVWRDEIFRRFPLILDAPPDEDELTRILHQVGKKARESKRVEVPFDNIAPKLSQYWTGSTSGDLQVAIGRMGATRLQMFRLGKGVAQHALVAGKTGSGKSTMLHALISNLAMWYSPDEIELYLIDFKKGVEFKTYATHNLPHARAIAVESDREFGLSVLQRIDAELARRGNLYRKYGVQDLASFREASGEVMPRTLLVIDEFQEFFSEDDKLAQDASLLLDRLVRQGRAFGVHVLLGSQTIGGSSGLSRSTIGQMAVRIALQTSEADSQLILGDGNSAARLLSRPGEAIYNDAGGLVEGNSPFQVAWLPDERREIYLKAVREKADKAGCTAEPAIVFEGNAPSDYHKNAKLALLIALPEYPALSSAPLVWLGEPVAIKDPTAIIFRPQSGSNVMIIGQNEEAALAMISLAIVALAAQLPPKSASFYVLDGSAADSLSFGVLAKVAGCVPNAAKSVDYRGVGDAIHEIAEELKRRQSSDSADFPSIFIIIFGLQRYRVLRKQEDSFAFSSGDEDKPADPGKEFADILREGPSLGIFIIAWVDTVVALDRTLDRGAMREFDNRILFQMSAADSSNLIDSPAANKLGVYRAMAYSEEQGTIEKFRPYAQPDTAWLENVKKAFESKRAGTNGSSAKPADAVK